MEPQALSTEIRNERGKTAARNLRVAARIPAVFYGPGTEPIALSVSPKELVHALTTDLRRNVVLKLDLAGTTHYAMVKDVQVHPVTRAPLHADLYKVSLDVPVLANVPLRSSGRAKGVIAGGEVNVMYRDLPVRATPDKIPAVIEVDVTNLELNQTLRVKDLALPEGVSVAMGADRSVISCAEARKKLTDEEATAAEGGAPAAAAPAAGAKAAAKPAAKPAAKK